MFHKIEKNDVHRSACDKLNCHGDDAIILVTVRTPGGLDDRGWIRDGE